MKVSELIAKLQKCNPDSIVKLDDWNEGYAAPKELNWVWEDKGSNEVELSVKEGQE
jgi:hypothetical protein